MKRIIAMGGGGLLSLRDTEESGVAWPDVQRIDQPISEFLREVGVVFATFEGRPRDSGNASYGVRIGGERYFVKTAGSPATAKPRSHSARVERLRNAVELRRSVQSAVMPELHAVMESPLGPALVYSWVDGELLYAEPERRSDRNSALSRFCALPTGEILNVLDSTFSLHVELASAGWVASDFYDGCFLYEFPGAALHLVDFDEYRRGPFVNDMGRMPGSTRFMAPEELRLGEWIDERTTVFNLGRAALVFLAGGKASRPSFRGSDAQHGVLMKACAENPGARFQSVSEFHLAWQVAGRQDALFAGGAQ